MSFAGEKSSRNNFFQILTDYWWIVVALIVLGAILTDVGVLVVLAGAIGFLFLIFLFFPILLQFFSPSFILFLALKEHFKKSKGMSFGEKYVFMPLLLLSVSLFIMAQIVLSGWVLVITYLIWSALIGFFWSFIAIFFFGLTPFAIILAPFIAWSQTGFTGFLSTIIFFLLTLFWYSFNNLISPPESRFFEMTQENFFKYPPQYYMLGALSVQILAMPFLHIGFLSENMTLMKIGDILSGWGGLLFIVLALISWIQWLGFKKTLSKSVLDSIYRPSVWIYVLGFFVTNILYYLFNTVYIAPVFALYWLNLIFFVAILYRLFIYLKTKFFRKKK